MPPVSDFSIRQAAPADVKSLLELMLELARYEKLDHLFVTQEQDLSKWLFESPISSAFVALDGDHIVGYAVFFRSFSTFLGKPGFWLEDIYVTPSHRGKGIGKDLLRTIAREAVEHGHARVEWAVLDWNQPAIDFYKSIGATVMEDWRVCRLTGQELDRFAAS